MWTWHSFPSIRTQGISGRSKAISPSAKSRWWSLFISQSVGSIARNKLSSWAHFRSSKPWLCWCSRLQFRINRTRLRTLFCRPMPANPIFLPLFLLHEYFNPVWEWANSHLEISSPCAHSARGFSLVPPRAVVFREISWAWSWFPSSTGSFGSCTPWCASSFHCSDCLHSSFPQTSWPWAYQNSRLVIIW